MLPGLNDGILYFHDARNESSGQYYPARSPFDLDNELPYISPVNNTAGMDLLSYPVPPILQIHPDKPPVAIVSYLPRCKHVSDSDKDRKLWVSSPLEALLKP